MRKTLASYAPAVFAVILAALFLPCAARAQDDPAKVYKARCELCPRPRQFGRELGNSFRASVSGNSNQRSVRTTPCSAS